MKEEDMDRGLWDKLSTHLWENTLLPTTTKTLPGGGHVIDGVCYECHYLSQGTDIYHETSCTIGAIFEALNAAEPTLKQIDRLHKAGI